MDYEDNAGFDPSFNTPLSTQPQSGLGVLTPPEPKVNELTYDPTLINETVQQPKFGGSFESLFPSTSSTTPRFNSIGDPLYGSDPAGFDPNNLGFVADQAPLEDALTFLSKNPSGIADSPEQQKIIDDYYIANPINFDADAFINAWNSADPDKPINDLTQQILGQNITDKWTGAGHGSAEANAKDMARILSSIGISDIRQFGKVDKYEPVQEGYKTYNGYRVTKTYADENGLGGGKYVYTRPTDKIDGEGFPILETAVVPEGGKLESHYGFAEDFGEGGSTFTPVDSSKVVNRNGVMFAPTGKTTYGNKVTGQEVPNTYSERQTGNAWGGTFAGKGNTGYRVDFTDDGMPVFYTTGASSSDLGKIAPLLSIASFIPGLQPFAMAANAAIAASQGNVLGALAGAAGLGGFSDIANAANFAGAVKSGNPLSIISSGANLGGTDLSGVANAAGLGDLSNIAGFNANDIAKTYQTVKALKSGDPASIISALGGYVAGSDNQTPSSPLDSVVPSDYNNVSSGGSYNAPPKPDDDFSNYYSGSEFGFEEPISRPIAERPIDSSIGATSPTDMPRIAFNPTDLYQEPIRTPEPTPDMTGKSFNSAFAQARASGAKEFLWNGDVFHTNLADKASKTYDPVGGGRGVQGGPTAQEIARANAVRGNPPPSDFANWASSVFPSAQAGAVAGTKASDASSQIPGYGGLIPPSTSDQNNSVFGQIGDALGLPQEFQRNFGNTLNALPGLNFPIGAAGRFVGAVDDLGAGAAARNSSMYVEPTRLTADPTKMFKLIDSLPDSVYRTPAVQEALQAAASGDGVKAFRLLESNPATAKELLKYADKMGAQELSPYKNLHRYNLPNPAEYRRKPGGGYSPKTGGGGKAEGGLASLNKSGER